MKIQISLSSDLPEGARVAVKQDKDTYFVATVVKKVTSGYKVKYDDNGDTKVEKGTLVRLDDKMKNRKLSITKAEVEKFKYDPAAKPARVKAKPTAEEPKIYPSATSEVNAVLVANKISDRLMKNGGSLSFIGPDASDWPEEPKLPKLQDLDVKEWLSLYLSLQAKYKNSSVPTIHIEPKVEKTVNAAEGNLVKLAGNSYLFRKAKESTKTADIFAYVKYVWFALNKRFFNGQLQKPVLHVLSERGKFKRLGHWRRTDREFAVSRRIFVPNTESVAVSLIAHEMCHQAVSEIDRDFSSDLGGHGYTWQNRMRQLGLEPHRYATQDTMENIRTESEQETIALQKAVEEHHKDLKIKPHRDCPAKWFDPKTGLWNRGLIVGPSNSRQTYWAFISKPSTANWINVPHDWFRSLDPGEDQLYTTPAFLEAARFLRRHKTLK